MIQLKKINKKFKNDKICILDCGIKNRYFYSMLYFRVYDNSYFLIIQLQIQFLVLRSVALKYGVQNVIIVLLTNWFSQAQ